MILKPIHSLNEFHFIAMHCSWKGYENSKIKVEADSFVGGSSSAGVGYTTTTSY